MTSERWQQIDQLFHSTLQRESGERAAFLAQACNGDESLRQEVESLIGSHEQSESFIEAPACDIAAELLAEREGRLRTGEFVGHYRIVSLLEEGGMGEVYLAQDVRLGRQVALKRLPAQFTLDAERVHRFEQEARAASALNHPNIITIHEIGRSDATHFITTEFIDGETLRRHMTRGMKLDEALEIAAQVASALVAAHDAGIAHRDIKPENIMIRRDGIVKVLDFGLAKLASQTVNSEAPTKTLVKTNPGMVMGTVQYMSPEQAHGDEVDTRTDIWSLGVVLYEMVTGRLPFDGETPSHVIVSILEVEPNSLTHYSNVPAELEGFVSKALRKNKTKRYQTAGDLVIDLKDMKQKWEARLKGTLTPDPFVGALSGGWLKDANAAPQKSSNRSALSSVLRSSTEYLIGQFKEHRRSVLLVVAAILVGLASTLFYFVSARDPIASSKEKISSIAVLPFVNTSSDPNIEYLSEGLSESLINSLSQLPGMKVTSRSSSFKYKDKEVDPREVAHALGVEAILTGRILRQGDNLIVSVELMDARDETHVWGKQYTRKESDLVTVQADVFREIAQALRVRLSPVEEQLVRFETENPEAYELLLKGRFYWNRGGTKDRKTAVEYFQKALAADPGYALAYAELSLSYSSLVNQNIFDPKVFTPKAEAAAQKAFELNESLAEVHLAMAVIKTDAWDWSAAEREFKRAIGLNPSLSRAHINYTFFLIIQGRGEQALDEANRARELDPLSTGANSVVVYSLILTHHYDQALEAVKRMLELHRSNPDVHTLLGQAYEAKGQYLEALAAYQEAIRLGDRSPDMQIALGAIYAKTGQLEKTRAILKQLEKGNEYVSPVGFAILHVALGELEQALALLGEAYAAHDQQLIWLGVEGSGEGVFAPLSSDPRFANLMRRVGLTT
jgi:eukaryotic-like serine/threonine-protein kinase